MPSLTDMSPIVACFWLHFQFSFVSAALYYAVHAWSEFTVITEKF